MFGASGFQPESVVGMVRTWFAKGQPSIPVNWDLLLGRDPRPPAYKYLTVTFSTTQIEGKELVFPTLTNGGGADNSRAQAVPTHLHLQFGAQGVMPLCIEQKNVWRWFPLQPVAQHQEKKGQAPKMLRMWTVFLNFDAPVMIKQLRVSANGTLPIHE